MDFMAHIIIITDAFENRTTETVNMKVLAHRMLLNKCFI